MNRVLFYLLLALGSFFVTHQAFASFGITPPYVRNDSLTRGSHYEQRIILVRGDPVEDLQAKVSVSIPGAGDWISIDKGTDFILPKGAQQVPMVVRVDIPDKAKLGEYKGTMSVVISSLSGPQAGTVGIALGAQIDVDLNVIDQKIVNFNIRSVKIDDLEEGHSFWWMYFPGKIRFNMQIENLGNIAAAPYGVHFEIYDNAGTTLLEKTDNTNGLKKIQPFAIDTITAELPTKLAPGNYKARYTIFKAKGQVGQQGELTLSVLPRGTLLAYQGYGLNGLPLRDQLILALGTLIIAGAFVYIGRGLGRRRKRRRLASPPSPPRR